MALTLQLVHKVCKAQLGLVTRQDGLGERPRWRVCDCITCTCQRYGGRSLPDTRCTYEKSWFDTPDMDWVRGKWWNVCFLNLQTMYDIPDVLIKSFGLIHQTTLLLQCIKWCIRPDEVAYQIPDVLVCGFTRRQDGLSEGVGKIRWRATSIASETTSRCIMCDY